MGVGRAGWTTEKEFIPGLPNPSGTFPRNLSNGCYLFYDRVPRTASDLKHFGTGLVGVWRWVCLGISLKVVKPSRQGEERGELGKLLRNFTKSWFPSHSHTN